MSPDPPAPLTPEEENRVEKVAFLLNYNRIDGSSLVFRLLAAYRDLRLRVEKAEAFKAWTHQYLDSHGVPYHPPGIHGAEGCRIGDRMDWLMAENDRLRTKLDDVIETWQNETAFVAKTVAAAVAEERERIAQQVWDMPPFAFDAPAEMVRQSIVACIRCGAK